MALKQTSFMVAKTKFTKTVLLAFTALAPMFAPSQDQHATGNAPVKPDLPSLVLSAKIAPPQSFYQFPANQVFHYSVEWRLFNAGTTTVRLDNVNGERHVITSADSIGAVALLYHVHDQFETFFNPQTNCSLSLTKHTEEGFRRVETKVRYDYASGKSILDENNLRAKSQKHQEDDIPSCVGDMISAVYYVASQRLEPGASLTFPINDGGKTAAIQAQVEARETLKLSSGTYKTIRVSAEALNGPQKGKGKLWVWYSDDDRRLPVQVRTRAFWGTLLFRLVSISPITPAKK